MADEESQELTPVEQWSEVDEDYEDVPVLDDEVDDLDEEEVPEDDDVSADEDDDVAPLKPFWVRYELAGRNVSADTGWEILASEDFDGEFEIQVEHLTAGASWEFRVRLIDHNGRQSKWSDVVSILLPVDTVPPPSPTAPTKSEAAGYVTLGWDGDLVASTPEDLSHVDLRLQQMHPPEDPNGEAGDPYRVSSFTRASEWGSGSLIPGVLYEAFLVAVDTTGNESPWSDRVEFIPSETFDSSELENKLEDLNENRLPALENSLATGIQGAYDHANSVAETAKNNAVNQAAANAQSEYDRLQEIAERALSRAGDNLVEDPSFETEYWADEWNGLGGRVVRTTTNSANVRTGDQGLVIEGGSVVELPIVEVNAELGQSYRMQLWVRSWPTQLPDFGSDTRLRLVDLDTSAVVAESEPVVASSEWVRVTVTYEVDESVSSLAAVLAVDHTSGLFIVDDLSVQEVGAAAEALRLAEVARQQAEAAHIAAGNAMDTAADAYAVASAKNTIHWSLTAPSGTGSEGDVWWQYETSDNRRIVTGQWFYEDGIWETSELSEEYLPLVNIGTGTYGDLDGVRIRSGTIEVRQLAVRDHENYMPIEVLEDLRDNGLDSPLWSGPAENANGFTTINNQGGMPVAIRWNGPVPANSGTARIEFAPGGKGMAVRPGEQIRLNGYGWRATGDPGNVGVRFAFHDNSGGFIDWGPTTTGHAFAAGWNNFEIKATVPSNDAIRYVTLDFYGQTDSNRGHWGNFQWFRGVQGKAVIDGLLQAGTAELQRLFFDEAVGNSIAAGSGEFLEVDADQIRSNTWNGQTMTGPVVQSHEAPNIGWKLTPADGLEIWNVSGDKTVQIDGVNNQLTGRLVTSTQAGHRIAMDQGTVTYRDPIRAAQRTVHNAPHLSIRADGTAESDAAYLLIDDNELVLAGGHDQYGSSRNVRIPNQIIAYSGLFEHAVSAGWAQGEGGVTLDPLGAVYVNGGDQQLSDTGLYMRTSDSNQPAGIRVDGPRTYLRGRPPSSHFENQTTVQVIVGSYTVSPGAAARGSITYGTPVPGGRRMTQVSSHVSSTSYGNWNTVIASGSSLSASGVDYVVRAPSNNSNDAGYWVIARGVWE